MAQWHVVDANVTLGLFLRLPYSERVDRWLQERQAEEAKLVVPLLWEYECVTGLRRAAALKQITSQAAGRMAEKLLALEFQRAAPSPELHRAALAWAGRIGHTKAYDAQYLALAESLAAEFWTADQKLFRSVEALGIPWIHAV